MWWWKNIVMIEKDCDNGKILWWWKGLWWLEGIMITKKYSDKKEEIEKDDHK